MPSKRISAEVRAELLNPESWSSTLDSFGRTANIAVALTDEAGVMLGECQNPQPLWFLTRDRADIDPTMCPFCVLKGTRCSIVAEALLKGKVTKIKNAAGLAHIAAPLFLDGEALGAVIAGQVYVEYPQPLAVQRMANELQIPMQKVWAAATGRPPIRPATLQGYGEFLASLGQALVGERYAAVLAKKLQRALEEKTTLLQEVHHRVKNNMAVVSSLLGLQADSISNQEAAARLRESQMRVLCMASIHEHLYGSESLKYIRFDLYAKELVESISLLFSASNVRVEVEFSQVEMNLDESIPCGLILNELLTNTFKYAFPDNESGVVTISLLVPSPGLFRVSVEDNGIGFPTTFELKESKSLGLRIVRTLTRQLSGTLELRQQGGSRFEITFPSERAAIPT